MIKFRNQRKPNKKRGQRTESVQIHDPIKERVFWNQENIPNDISILLRNLSSHSLIRVKQLFDLQFEKEATLQKGGSTEISGKKSDKSIKKNKKSKKEQIIIASQKKRDTRDLKDDQEKYEIFKKEKNPNFEEWLPRFKTVQARERVKLAALKKEKDPHRKLEIYLHLDRTHLKDSDQKTYEKYHSQYKDKPLKRYQLKCMGSRLPPLDTFNPKQFTLDDWQMDVIRKILAGNSILVCAPTSSGKTVLTTYFASTNKKILYVVPSKPLALQVAAAFQQQSREEVAILVDDLTYLPSVNYSTIVATPYHLENKLPFLEDFLQPSHCFAIFDEVHNLNGEMGEAYERVMKWLQIPFLALSATIENPQDIQTWLHRIHPERPIEVVQYKKRFINIQRNVWDIKKEKLTHLHPLSCLQTSDFENPDGLPSLPFTPWDCYTIWTSLHQSDSIPENLREPIHTLDPELYFAQKPLIHLDDVRDYEWSLKKCLADLPKEVLSDILATYHMEETPPKNESWKLLTLLQNLREQKLFPCIAFQENSNYAREMYYELVSTLETDEAIYYPFHYTDAEFKQELFDDYTTRRKKLIEETKSMDVEAFLMRFDAKELTQYQAQITHRYKSNLSKIDTWETDKTYCETTIKTIKKNLEAEYRMVLNANSILPVDQFEKHKDYCLTYPPMSADQIRTIRRTIMNKTGIKMDYTHPLIQGLKRGVGLYEKGLPDAYLQIVQKLAQSKELSVVISDASLALGIHMPFKTSLVAGWKDSNQLNTMLFQQMAGRAGRRGHDTEGHVVFANLSWKRLMKAGFQQVSGCHRIPPAYSTARLFDGCISSAYQKVFGPSLRSFVYPNSQQESTNELVSLTQLNDLEVFEKKILWKLRQYPTGILELIQAGNQLNLQYKRESLRAQDIRKMLALVFEMVMLQQKQDVWLFDDKLSSIQSILVLQKLPEELSPKEKVYWISNIKELGSIVKIFHNTIQSEEMTHLKRLYKKCFDQCQHIISKYVLN